MNDPTGFRNYQLLLTTPPDELEAIKTMSKYKVSKSTISAVLNQKSWRHVR